jgi:hypothetical protein
MASELRVSSVKLPNVVTAPCPMDVIVEVINVGPDPASFPSPMRVCLDILTSPEGPTAHFHIEIPAESPPMHKGVTYPFKFTGVRFPCAPSASVIATPDCTGSVPGNIRTPASAMTISVPQVVLVPWLFTDIRVGLQDSTGNITFAPGALCPGATCVAEVSIRNAGCGVADASVTALELLDGAGQSIASLKQNTPVIAAGATTVVQFVTVLPASVTGNRITVRGCADDQKVVKLQCDRSHACAEVPLKLAVATGGPQVTFFAKKPIFPGEVVPMSWRIRNFCTDIGKATARISFQGTVLYTSVPHPVGLQDVDKGEDIDVAPTAAVAPNFYKVGTSTLTLEITGTGKDPGPYTATAPVTVSPEPVSGTWVFTVPAPGTTGVFPWKRFYTVEGRLTNPTHATMLPPSSVVLNETSTVVPSIARIASPPIGTIVPGAFGSAIWSLLQSWSWIVPGPWALITPPNGRFDYTVTFAMQDVYGNAYPATTSAVALVNIDVAGYKLALAVVANVMFHTGIVLTILGILAAAGVVTIVVAAVLFTLAGIAFTLSAAFGFGALDPPVPNFDYRSIVAARWPELPAEPKEYPALVPLFPLFALLGRISGVAEAMSATEARLIAARIDRDTKAIQLQESEYRALLDSLLAAARQIPLAAVEASDSVRADPLLGTLMDARALQQTVDAWSRDGLPKELHHVWFERGLPEQQLNEIDKTMRARDFVVRPIDVLFGELTQAVPQIARGVEEEAEAVLHPEGGGEKRR